MVHKKGKTKRKLVVRRKNHKKGYKKYNNGVILGGSLACPFPPSIRSKFRTKYFQKIITTIAGAGTAQAYELCFMANNAVNIGPRINYPLGTLSSGALNAPTGIYYLISSLDNGQGGSRAPYSRYFVRSCGIKVRVSSIGVNNGALAVIVYPRINAVDAGGDLLVNTAAAEQEHAKMIVIPPVLNNEPKEIRHFMTTQKAFGLSKTISRDNVNYTGVPSAAPAEQWQWVVRICNLDPTETGPYTVAVAVELDHDVDLYQRNPMSSGAPSIAGATGTTGAGYYTFTGVGATGAFGFGTSDGEIGLLGGVGSTGASYTRY